jgi:hypothetical protein
MEVKREPGPAVSSGAWEVGGPEDGDCAHKPTENARRQATALKDLLRSMCFEISLNSVALEWSVLQCGTEWV